MEPFLGEIRLFSFGRIPNGWLPCNGQVLQISTNAALASLLGNRYGGDGKTTFALPDLRGRVPVHMSPAFQQGQAGGAENVTLTTAQLPPHRHMVMAYNTDGNTGALNSGFPAQAAMPQNVSAPPPPVPAAYGNAANLIPIAAASVASSGALQAHENRQPSIAMNYCIATQGLFPPRS